MGRFTLLVICALAILVGCEKKEAASEQAVVEAPRPPMPVVVQAFLPLKVEPQTFKKRKAGCKGEKCAEVVVDAVRFPENAALTSLLEKTLVGLSQELLNEGSATFESYANTFLKSAGDYYSATLNAKMMRQQGPLVLIRLDAHLYTGGAHGMPVTSFLNYDRQQNRALTLDDVVQDGKRPALIEKLKQAHAAWLKASGDDTNADFQKLWPFVETDNFALTDKGMAFVYQAYAIGPYSYGQPELLIPYTELATILKPEWLLKGS